MPKTKFQNVVFTLMMSFLMVYAMICYNISMNIGGMTNQVFLMAFHEMIIMWPAAFILEFFLVDHLAHKLAFCISFLRNYGKFTLPDMMNRENRQMSELSIRFRGKRLQSYFLYSVPTGRAAERHAGQ